MPCRTLDLALLGAIQVNEEGSVAVHLLPSEHYSITNSYNFVGRNGFQLNLWEKRQEIAEQFVATVSCSGALAGLAFFNSTSITIENVKFIGCGAERNSTSRDQSSPGKRFLEFRVTLYFLFCSDVTMESVTIENSNGTALVLYGTVGRTVSRTASSLETRLTILNLVEEVVAE